MQELDLTSIREKLTPYLPDILEIKGKEIVLFLGITGSGKSTGISALLGQDLIYKGKILIPNPEAHYDNTKYPKIGVDPMKSESPSSAIYPSQKGYSYCDTVGLLDTDELEGRIIASISLELAVRLSSQIKAVVVVINQHDLHSQKAKTFKDLSKLLNLLFKGNFKNHGQSIAFLITQENPKDLRYDGAQKIQEYHIESFEDTIKRTERNYGQLLSCMEKGTAFENVVDKLFPKNPNKKLKNAKEDLLIKDFFEMMVNPERLIIMDYKYGDTFQDRLHEFIENSKPLPKEAFSFSGHDTSRTLFDQMIHEATSLHHKSLAFIESYPKEIVLYDKKVLNIQSEINRKEKRLSALNNGDESIEVEKINTKNEIEIQRLYLENVDTRLNGLCSSQDAYIQDRELRKSEDEVVYVALKFEDFEPQIEPDEGKYKTFVYEYGKETPNEQKTPIISVKGPKRVQELFTDMLDLEEGLSRFNLKYSSNNIFDWWFASKSLSTGDYIDDYVKGLVLKTFEEIDISFDKSDNSDIITYLLSGEVGKEKFEDSTPKEPSGFFPAYSLFQGNLFYKAFIRSEKQRDYMSRLENIVIWAKREGKDYLLDSLQNIANGLIVTNSFVLLMTKLKFLPENVKWVDMLEEKIEKIKASIELEQREFDRISEEINSLNEKLENLEWGIQDEHEEKIAKIQDEIFILGNMIEKAEAEKRSLGKQFEDSKKHIEDKKEEILFVSDMLQSLSYDTEHPLRRGFLDYCKNYFNHPGRQINGFNENVDLIYQAAFYTEIFKGLTLHPISRDDSNRSLFQAIAHHAHEEGDYEILRGAMIAHLEANQNEFEPFVTNDFKTYADDIFSGVSLVGEIELKIIQRIINRPIVVLKPDTDPDIFPNDLENYDFEGSPIFIYQTGGSHYDTFDLSRDVSAEEVLMRIRFALDDDKPVMYDQTLMQSYEHLLSSEPNFDQEVLYRMVDNVSGQEFLKAFENTARLKAKNDIGKQSDEKALLEKDLKAMNTIFYYRETYFKENFPDSPTNNKRISDPQDDANIRYAQVSADNKQLKNEIALLKEKNEHLEEEKMQLQERLIKLMDYVEEHIHLAKNKSVDRFGFNQ